MRKLTKKIRTHRGEGHTKSGNFSQTINVKNRKILHIKRKLYLFAENVERRGRRSGKYIIKK